MSSLILFIGFSMNQDDAFAFEQKLEFGSFGSGNGEFNNPRGVSLGESPNDLYITDTGNHRIKVHDADGIFQNIFGSKCEINGNNLAEFSILGTGASVISAYKMDEDGNIGDVFFTLEQTLVSSQNVLGFGVGCADPDGNEGPLEVGDGQFFNPFGIDIDLDGNRVYVLDTFNDRVQIFDLDGNFISKFGGFGFGDGEFNKPFGIAVNATANRIYISDTGNDRVQIFDLDGNFISKFGGFGNGDGKFDGPFGVTLHFSEDKIYVSDSGNSRIQVFDLDGNFIAKFGGFGSGPGQMILPREISLDTPANNLYVIDSGNNRIHVFDSDGVFIDKFGTLGSGNDQFKNPYGIKVDDKGTTYVVDTENNKIQIFYPKLLMILEMGSSGSGDGQFSLPHGVAVDSFDNIYVADMGNHRIQKFDSTGAYQSKFGSSGSGNGQFENIQGIAVDSFDNIYISDIGDLLDSPHLTHIQKFDSTGAYQSHVGSYGFGNDQYAGPQGIAVDSFDNIYVADDQINRIQKFDSTGAYQSKFGSSGSGNGQFSLPHGVAVDSLDNIYVADMGNHRIQKFDSTGAFLTKINESGPNAVTIDSSNRIIVSANNNKISISIFLPMNQHDFDLDSDLIANTLDNCPNISNANQLDTDNDGAGDVCDSTPNGDDDSDGVDNLIDNCRGTTNPDQTDTDGSGIGDACNNAFDADGDEFEDEFDPFPNEPVGITETSCNAIGGTWINSTPDICKLDIDFNISASNIMEVPSGVLLWTNTLSTFTNNGQVVIEGQWRISGTLINNDLVINNSTFRNLGTTINNNTITNNGEMENVKNLENNGLINNTGTFTHEWNSNFTGNAVVGGIIEDIRNVTLSEESCIGILFEHFYPFWDDFTSTCFSGADGFDTIINPGSTLLIPNGVTLFIEEGDALFNNGTVNNSGTITIDCLGTVTGIISGNAVVGICDYVIEDDVSCEAIGGSGSSFCRLDVDFTTYAGDTFEILDIGFVILPNSIFTNNGNVTFNSFDSFSLGGEFINNGFLTINNGDFESFGTLTNNGTVENNGFMENNVYMINNGIVENNYVFGNFGILVNNSTITNNGDMANLETLVNNGSIINNGEFFHEWNSIFSGNPVSGDTISDSRSLSVSDNPTCIKIDFAPVSWSNNICTLLGTHTINPGNTLTIPDTTTLMINSGVTLANNGTISNSGKIVNDGILDNFATINNSGIIENQCNGVINGVVSGNAVERRCEYIISTQSSCEIIGGTWINIGNPLCRLNVDLTLNSTDILTIPSGFRFFVDSLSTITNNGNITNNGSEFNINEGTIINNGNITANTFMNNVGTIINNDTITINDNFLHQGTIINNGIINNLGNFNHLWNSAFTGNPIEGVGGIDDNRTLTVTEFSCDSELFGFWDFVDTCELFEYTINSGNTLIVPNGVNLEIQNYIIIKDGAKILIKFGGSLVVTP